MPSSWPISTVSPTFVFHSPITPAKDDWIGYTALSVSTSHSSSSNSMGSPGFFKSETTFALRIPSPMTGTVMLCTWRLPASAVVGIVDPGSGNSGSGAVRPESSRLVGTTAMRSCFVAIERRIALTIRSTSGNAAYS